MSLLSRYRGIVCDLDGVVYRGPDPVEHAIEALNDCGLSVIYATNNASRPPAVVADQLRDLGLHLDDADVLNSSQVGAAEVASRVAEGAPVLAVGGPGVAQALVEAGLSPVGVSTWSDEHVEAVLQGYGHDVTAGDLGRAAFVVQGGAVWVATNDDLTLPTERGMAPGNGSLVGAVRNAVEVDPVVVGKPHPPMYVLAAQRSGLSPAQVLAVGDRLDTDVAGAVATGIDSVLVLTGVDGVRTLAVAGPEMRPTYVLADLRGLSEDYVGAVVDGDGTARCRDATVMRVPDGLAVAEPPRDRPRDLSSLPIEVVRAFAAAAHRARDEGVLSAEQVLASVDALV